MIIIEIDNIMGGNIILWTVECEREETCFDYYSWDFLEEKKEFFCQPYKSMNVNTDFIYVKTFAATQNI